MSEIHETAIIHPSSIIGENVTIGENCKIGPNCIIEGRTKIGANCVFVGFASIGTNAEHKTFFDKEGRTILCNNITVREFVTINAGTNGTTYIESDCIFLRGSHVGHDSHISEKSTISCNVIIGGHSHLQRGCNIGLGAILHQNTIIGAFSMVGMGAVVTKKSIIEPGKIYAGNPSKYIGENKIGLGRSLIYFEALEAERRSFRRLRHGT